MKIKKICVLLMLILHCILINNYYHAADLSVLYRGVNSSNNMILLAAYFSNYCATAFYMFEKVEKYVNGYGKYTLIRNKKRTSVLNGMYIKGCLFALTCELLKILLYIVIAGVNNTNFSNLIVMIFLSILVNILMIYIQIFLEIFLGSKIALASVMMYFILSCTVGGLIIKENIYKPLIFLIPNYSMSLRTKYFTSNLNLKYESIIIILILTIFLGFVMGKLNLKRKDIF